MSEDPRNESESIAFKVGELTGVIKEFSGGIHRKLDDMNSNINGKIGLEKCQNVVNKAIKDHKKDDHAEPGATLSISGPFLKKMIPWVGGIGGGGFGLWAMLEKFLGN